MSKETLCFIADLYVNGKLVGVCSNDGWGGCTTYSGNSREDNKLLSEIDNYYKTLPMEESKFFKNFKFQPTLDNTIDELFCEWLKKRENRKFKRLMESSIIFGKRTEKIVSYSFCKQKCKLSDYPTVVLQDLVDKIKTKYCKDGVVILNTNLTKLGIKY